jgi:hypothetical protein
VQGLLLVSSNIVLQGVVSKRTSLYLRHVLSTVFNTVMLFGSCNCLMRVTCDWGSLRTQTGPDCPMYRGAEHLNANPHSFLVRFNTKQKYVLQAHPFRSNVHHPTTASAHYVETRSVEK